MTTPRPQGWMARLSSSMAPLADPDDKSPVVRPVTIVVATVIGILSGLIFLYAGVGSAFSVDQQIEGQRTWWTTVVTQCESDPAVGAIGDKVPATLTGTPTLNSPIPATALAEVCKQATTREAPADRLSTIRTQLMVVSIVVALIGAAVLVAAGYLQTGARWTRRVLVGMALLMLGLAMFLQVSSVFTLVATMLLILALVLTFLGRGGLFFARLALANKRH